MIWTSFALIFLGLWQCAAPATFGYEDPTHFFTGLLLIIGGFYLRRQSSFPVRWALAFVGLFLQLSPLLFWAKSPAQYLNDTLIGVLVILFAIIFPSHEKAETPSLPPGWSYNPSTWPSRILIAFFATIGWFISRYLAAYQLGYIHTMWDPFFGNGTINVITSAVSRAFPVSDAGLGAASYTIELLLACYGGRMRWCHSPWLVIIYGILVVPVSIVSIVLIILQPLAVGSWCTLCILTAICMLVMATLAVGELVLVVQMLIKSRGTGFWKGFNVQQTSADKRTLAVHSPLKDLLLFALTGITPTWRLLVSAVLGVILITSQSLKDLDPIFGALVIVTSVLSMVEPIRSWRFANAAWGCLILGALFWTGSVLLMHGAIAILLIWLSLKAGTKREECRC
ncbi:MAG: dTDP-glucose 4,6-dehydratase [Verrucomicrobia bacterium]|nr:dTDP-glucose 4,6-dehydratase [Verrucomicrobiota bacterium]